MTHSGYKLDFAFVIDRTSNKIMANLKENIFLLVDKIHEAINERYSHRPVKDIRVRVIDYGDFAIDGKDAIHTTDFLTLPAEKDKLEQVIDGICVSCRADKSPKNGLEALHNAICSKWISIDSGERGRHIIILMSENLPLHFGECDGCEGYNKDDYPHDIEDLTEVWHAEYPIGAPMVDIDYKRLVLFVPEGRDDEGHSWDNVSNWEWTSTINLPNTFKPENVLYDILYDIARPSNCAEQMY